MDPIIETLRKQIDVVDSEIDGIIKANPRFGTLGNDSGR